MAAVATGQDRREIRADSFQFEFPFQLLDSIHEFGHGVLDRIDSLRKRIVQRAARLTRPAGALVLTLARAPAVEHDLERLLKPRGRAA